MRVGPQSNMISVLLRRGELGLGTHTHIYRGTCKD